MPTTQDYDLLLRMEDAVCELKNIDRMIGRRNMKMCHRNGDERGGEGVCYNTVARRLK